MVHSNIRKINSKLSYKILRKYNPSKISNKTSYTYFVVMYYENKRIEKYFSFVYNISELEKKIRNYYKTHVVFVKSFKDPNDTIEYLYKEIEKNKKSKLDGLEDLKKLVIEKPHKKEEIEDLAEDYNILMNRKISKIEKRIKQIKNKIERDKKIEQRKYKDAIFDIRGNNFKIISKKYNIDESKLRKFKKIVDEKGTINIDYS